jgi:hypothetical protein
VRLIQVGKVNHGLLQARGKFAKFVAHEPSMSQDSLCVKYIVIP